METVGERLKKVRSKTGLTQEKLGKLVGMKWYQIKDLETGKVKKMSLALAESLASKFHVNKEWLLTGEGEMLLYPSLGNNDLDELIKIGVEEVLKKQKETETDELLAEAKKILLSDTTLAEALRSNIESSIYIFRKTKAV